MAERQEIVLPLEQIVWERLNRPLGWQTKCKLLLADLLLFYARLASKHRLAPGEASPHFKQILKAVAYIETHFDQELLVEDIAREAGLSAGYLTRQFKQSLGSSPSEYARNFRMAKAAELLREEELNIADIAEKLGFSDIALFSRQFRQVTGVSPTGFRKNS
jgi:AraC-like DNA-binding protein